MPGELVKAGNRLRVENDKLLLILLKLAKKLGGVGNLSKYGLTSEEIKFLKDEFSLE